jgi:hypothetical protein
MTMTIEMPEELARRVREKCEREGRDAGEVAAGFFLAWLEGEPAPARIEDTPMFGMWADREDMADPLEWVHKIRGPRKFDGI